jgi:hypothetical protein
MPKITAPPHVNDAFVGPNGNIIPRTALRVNGINPDLDPLFTRISDGAKTGFQQARAQYALNAAKQTVI